MRTRRETFDDALQRDWEGEDFALVEQVELDRHGEIRVDGAAFWTVEPSGDEPATTTNKNMNVAVKSADDRSAEERAAKIERLAAFYEKNTSGEGWVEE